MRLFNSHCKIQRVKNRVKRRKCLFYKGLRGFGTFKKVGKNRGIFRGLECMLFTYKKLLKMVDKSRKVWYNITCIKGILYPISTMLFEMEVI